MELYSGPKMANGRCGKTIDTGTIDRGSTVYIYIYACICVSTSITYTAIILHEALLIRPAFSLHICKQHGQWQPTQTTDNGIKKQKYLHTPDRRTGLPNKHCRFLIY